MISSTQWHCCDMCKLQPHLSLYCIYVHAKHDV